MRRDLIVKTPLRHLYRIWWEKCYGVSGSDVFLVSYPRSGNTWVRFMLLQARPDFREEDFRQIEEIIPDMHGPMPWFQCQRTTIVKSHLTYWQPFRRVIYLVRDGRAATYSNWCYQRDEGKHQISFEDYLERPRWPSSWGEHVAGWTKARETTLIVRYEDLLADPHKQLMSLCKAIGWPVTSQRVEQIVRNSSQEKMRALEQNSGVCLHRVGSGGNTCWRDAFSNKAQELFLSRLPEEARKWLV